MYDHHNGHPPLWGRGVLSNALMLEAVLAGGYACCWHAAMLQGSQFDTLAQLSVQQAVPGLTAAD